MNPSLSDPPDDHVVGNLQGGDQVELIVESLA